MDDPIEIQEDLSSEDVKRITAGAIIAVDCEMGGLNPARDHLYLLQIADPGDRVNLIRNARWDRAENLRQVMADRRITKVFHFAIMDCAFINANLAVETQNPYCTKIASKIARTYSNSHGLSNVVEELLGITMEKKLQTSFWGRPILTPDQIKYAANDVRYLLKVKQELEDILACKGNLPTGISYLELNRQCQQFIPTLLQLWTNGWDFGKEDPDLFFGR